MGTCVADIVDTLVPLTLSTSADVKVGAGMEGMNNKLKGGCDFESIVTIVTRRLTWADFEVIDVKCLLPLAPCLSSWLVSSPLAFIGMLLVAGTVLQAWKALV